MYILDIKFDSSSAASGSCPKEITSLWWKLFGTKFKSERVNE